MSSVEGIKKVADQREFLGIEKQEGNKDFGEFINEAIDKLNNLHVKSGELSNQLAVGDNVELHDVMIAAEEAGTAMRLTMELRNKVLEAYREVIRMPV